MPTYSRARPIGAGSTRWASTTSIFPGYIWAAINHNHVVRLLQADGGLAARRPPPAHRHHRGLHRRASPRPGQRLDERHPARHGLGLDALPHRRHLPRQQRRADLRRPRQRLGPEPQRLAAPHHHRHLGQQGRRLPERRHQRRLFGLGRLSEREEEVSALVYIFFFLLSMYIS